MIWIGHMMRMNPSRIPRQLERKLGARKRPGRLSITDQKGPKKNSESSHGPTINITLRVQYIGIPMLIITLKHFKISR